MQPSTTSYIHRISADGKAAKTIGSVGGRLNDIHIYSEEMGLNGQWLRLIQQIFSVNVSCLLICFHLYVLHISKVIKIIKSEVVETCCLSHTTF